LPPGSGTNFSNLQKSPSGPRPLPSCSRFAFCGSSCFSHAPPPIVERRTPRPSGRGEALDAVPLRTRASGAPRSVISFVIDLFSAGFCGQAGREVGWEERSRKSRRAPEPLPHFGSGDLKHPSFPPVAMGSSMSGLVDLLPSPYCATSSTHCHSAKSGQFVSRKFA
jgi:hypothetical protein